MKVAKFGGTSLADAAQIQKVCDIILSDPERRLIVVSAPGKRFADDIKVTDQLIRLADTFLADGDFAPQLDEIADRYRGIAAELGIPGQAEFVAADLRQRLARYSGDKLRLIDSLKAAGEDNCAKLVAKYLQSRGCRAAYLDPRPAGLLLSGEYGNATVLEESYHNLSKLKRLEGIGIFPGFFGYSLAGDVVTFPRGGSDITGAILAAAVEADVYENFTDVDYVYSVNPKIVKDPRPIRHITYSEMRELSYAGFNVYQEEALLPVFRAGISVNIKNVNNPACPGTLISATREADGSPVIGIASDDDFSCFYISKYLMNREIGFGRKLLTILEHEGVSFEHIPSGIDNMSVIVRSSRLTEEQKTRIAERIRLELHPDDLAVYDGLTIVMLVGEGMKRNIGVAARATSALARADTNIEMISQGSSEVSMVFGIKHTGGDKAVKALYEEFFK